MIKGQEVKLFYDPPDEEFQGYESRGGEGGRSRRSRGRFRRGGYSQNEDEYSNYAQASAPVPSFFRSEPKKEGELS